MNFLDSSAAERERLSAEKRAERRRKFRQIQWAAGILGSLFLIALFFAYFAWRQTQRAETNLQLAKKAVDESLSSVGSQQAREAGDLPQMEELRKGLLDKAAAFYTLFARQNSTDLSLRAEETRAHSRLGDINRLMGKYHDAAQEYRASIDGFGTLAKASPKQAEFRQGLAYAHNWLGETIREGLDNFPDFDNYKRSDAESEYSEALRLQEDLHREEPQNPAYQQELARTYYNRGIIRFQMNNSDGVQSDFRRAIALLETLAPTAHVASDSSGEPDPAQDLARVYNNYAIVMSRLGRTDEARGLYEKAIGLAEQLVKQRPEDREYAAELSQYSSNEARMLTEGEQAQLAEPRSQRSLDLLQQLAKPTPSLALKIAQALQLRGQLLLSQDPHEAEALTDQAFDMLKDIDTGTTANTSPLSATYMNIGVNYLELSQDLLRIGNTTRAGAVLVRVKDILPHLSTADKESLETPYKELLAKLPKGPTRH
jgi:tetratricopeptide (TPR) repeat protein